jgi:hypothetical protein
MFAETPDVPTALQLLGLTAVPDDFESLAS